MKSVKLFAMLFCAMSLVFCKRETKETESEDVTTIDSTQMESPADNATAKGTEMHHVMKDMLMRMRNAKPTGNSDHDLAVAMKEHHQGGIDLSNTFLDGDGDADLRSQAEAMKTKQQKEIEMLDSIIESSKNASADYDPAKKDEGLTKEMGKHLMEINKMPHIMDKPAEVQFAEMMTMHHKIGIDMSKTMEKYAKNPQLKSMASRMVSDMTYDITKLESWKSANNITE